MAAIRFGCGFEIAREVVVIAWVIGTWRLTQ